MATVLIVDDQPRNREYLRTLLGYGGHRLLEASDGAEGLEIARVERPDLAIVDLLMPKMDGYELVQQMRTEPAIAKTPVIFYTATYLAAEAATLAKSCGVSHILQKPCEPETVLSAVEEILNCNPTGASAIRLDELNREQLPVVSGKFNQKPELVIPRLGALIEFGNQVALVHDPLQLFESSCHFAREIAGAKFAAVVLNQDRGPAYRRFFASGMDIATAASVAAVLIDMDTKSAFRENRRLLRAADFASAAQFPIVPIGHPLRNEFFSVPIESAPEVYGRLYLAEKLGGGEFNADDEEAAKTLASQLAVAYDNTQRHEQQQRHAVRLEQEVAERIRIEAEVREQIRLAALGADIGTALITGETLQDMLRACAQSMVRNLDAAFARIWTFDPAGNMLELQASAGIYTHIDGPHSRIPVGQFKVGLIAQERKPHLTNDVHNDPRVSDRAWAKREGIIAFAGYPLLIEDRLVGVMGMFARKRIADRTLDAMESVANQIALGIERKNADQTLRDSEERFRQMAETITEVFWISNPDISEILYVSPAYEKVWGRTCESLYESPRSFLDAVHPADRDRVIECLQKQAVAGTFDTEFRVVHPDGSEHWIWDRGFAVRDNEGKAYRLCGIAQDITERKASEDALGKSEEQLRQAQKMEAVGRLAGGIAHDFNNLMTAVTGYSDLVLKAMNHADPLRQDVEEIKKAGLRAVALTRQLLAFSRRQVLHPKVLDLNFVVANMEKMLRRLIGEDIELVAAPAPTVHGVKADPGQIEQVILNLAVNARDAMPNGGKLIFETANVQLDDAYASQHSDVRPGHYVMLAVSDTGTGMDADTQARIFEPFFTTKEQGKGTGLGLSTVYGIVRQSGGHIWVYSELGVGTSMKIYLPAVEQSTESIIAGVEQPQCQPGSETILLVEDEDVVRSLARRILTANGYTVLEARNGQEAMQLVEKYERPIHMLLTDMIMPGMSGKELAERMHAIRPEIKSIYASGYTEQFTSSQGILEAGVTLIEKPFSEAQLIQTVRAVLDGSKGMST